MKPEAYCFHSSFEPAEPSEFQMDRHYLLYSLKGTMRLEAQGKRWTLPPARAALIAANFPVKITILSQLMSASVLFSTSFMEKPQSALSVFDISPLARELIRECRNWGADSGPLSPYARRIFETLADVTLQLAETPSPCVLPAPSSPALIKAVQLTEEQAHTTLNFVEIAKRSGLSPRSLARRFADEMGMTWREVLRRIRIIRAVEALAMSDDTVTQIALSVGYESLSGFNAAFRDLTKMNPTRYRASFKRAANNGT